MHPILFEIGGFPIHAYGALGALAFIVGAGLCLWRARLLGWNLDRVADVIFWMAITGLLGARLVFVLQNPGAVQTLGQLLDLRGGGLVFYGALIVGLPVGSLLMWRASLPYFAMWDIFGTAFPLAHAISRIGCYFAGCCYGTACDASWAVTFPANGIAPAGMPLHPVQLYEAAALLGIAVITNGFYRIKRFDGQVMLLYLVLYAVARSVVETFRGDVDRGYFLPEIFGSVLTYSQGMSLVFATVALGLFFFGARRAAAARAHTQAVGASITGPVAAEE